MLMPTEGWEGLYREKGEIYSDIIPQVKKYSEIFKTKKYKTILDLGCGTGRHSIFLAQRGFNVYASDISKTGVDITKKKAKSLGLTIKFKVCDMKKPLPYPTDYFDGVICIFVLGHGLLEENKKAIDEIYRVLRPEGTVITEFMSVKDKHMLHHYFTKDEIKELFSNFSKIKISDVKYWNMIDAFDVEAIK